MLKRTPSTVLAVLCLCVVMQGCSGDAGKPQGQPKNEKERESAVHRQKADRPEKRGEKSPPMDPYLAALFASPNDYELLDGVFNRIAAQCDGSDLRRLAALPEPQRIVLHVWGATGIVDNGGMAYLFESSLADFAGIAAAFDTVGVSAAADAIRDALELFPESKPPANAPHRLAYLGQLGELGHETLAQCSRDFWDAQRQIERKVAAYVRAHPEGFAGLSPHRQEKPGAMKGKNLPPPDPQAYSRDVARWLESIGAGILVATAEERDVWVSENLPGALRGDSRIVGVRLSSHRNSTDAELRSVATLEALSEACELDLKGTDVSPSGLGALKQIAGLRILSLRNTDVTNAWLPHLEGLAALEQLDLGESAITDAGLRQLAALTRLRSLDLYRTRISGKMLAALAKLPRLERLSLGDTQLDDDGVEALVAMTGLRSLDLRRTKITDEAMRHLEDMKGLEEIDLSDTRVGDLGIVRLKSLANLRYLHLDNTQISDEGLPCLAGLRRLEYLSLRTPDVTDTGAERLRQAMTNVEVRRK